MQGALIPLHPLIFVLWIYCISASIYISKHKKCSASISKQSILILTLIALGDDENLGFRSCAMVGNIMLQAGFENLEA